MDIRDRGRSENNMLVRITSLILALFLSSCAHYTKKGDVRFYESDGTLPFWSIFPAVPGHKMELPDISLARKATQVIKIRGLPEPMFPTWSYLRIPQKEDSKYDFDQPWRYSVVRFTYRDLSGRTLARTTVDFSRDWKGNSSPGGRSKRQIGIRISPWSRFASEEFPPVVDYDLVVEILVPSKRDSDFLRTFSFKPFKKK